MRKSLLAGFCTVGMTLASTASAAPLVNPTQGSWAEQLVELANLVRPQESQCSEHCWVLERLHMTGAVNEGKIHFEILGELLRKGAYEVPLFGPADKLRLEGVTENGAPATVGFEEGHYYVHTSSPHFTVRGTLVLPEDRTITVVGPLNTLDADVTGGRITEGAHVTALAATQLHFDAEGAAAPAQPPIFSIARALRVGKSIEFEYRVTAQSGDEVGVIHFPLRYGERVLDVAGSTGWRAEGEDLLLPTSGKKAEITITGTLTNVASFSPDPRAPFEWWLLETDAEHRIVATGDAKQHDAGESPIVRRAPSSRLFLVQRGQHLDVTVQTLQSVDVLAATVRSHSRMLVLTSAGDLVAQDVLTYDNNGLDYLYFAPDGKPLYLATDGAAERVMRPSARSAGPGWDDSSDLAVPMRIGQHTLTVQSLSEVSIGTLFGRIAMPGPRVPLATASEDVTFGLPESIHPIAVTGGERPMVPFSWGGTLALALSAIAASITFSSWKKRALGTATMFGLWFVSTPLFLTALAIGAATFVWPLTARLGQTTRRVGIALALLATVVVGMPLMVVRESATAPAAPPSPAANDLPVQAQAQVDDKKAAYGQTLHGNLALGHAGMLDGVRPVALSLPSYAHTAVASRQLLTPSGSFRPVVYYATDSALALLGLAWLACAGWLAWLSRDRLRALRDKVRVALAPDIRALPPDGGSGDPKPAPADANA